MKQSQVNGSGSFLLGLGVGAALGWIAAQQAWGIYKLCNSDAHKTLALYPPHVKTGLAFEEIEETPAFVKRRTLEDGIERIVYTPKNRRFRTPIVMQHGMWHGAWCWRLWQELLAEWGWESWAHSLPGHANSPVQRPLALCTLDYYLSFLRAEIERQPRRPILMGHSMGGALTQWYLKYVGDDLPAAVLVAPWVSHSMFKDGLVDLIRRDPLCALLMMRSWDATPMTRNPYRAAQTLISKQAVCSPEQLYANLGPESVLVLYQHNPPFWSPPEKVRTPMLWLAGEQDAVLNEPAERRSAAHYKADYVVAEKAGHNLMMEHNYRETALTIHNWLIKREIG